MSTPVVFTGPSLPAEGVAARLPGARVEPPAKRGDLVRLHAEGHGTFLILDGAFAHSLAVPVSEITRVQRAGARVIGAASLGAVRAAECWPAGMEGSGAVYRLYRLGVLAEDDEVAVATDPEDGFAAVTVALVNVRFALLAALRRGWVRRSVATEVLAVARETHFAERRWRSLLSDAGVSRSPELVRLGEQTDVKRRDAEQAVRRLSVSRPHADRPRRPLPPPPAPPGPHGRFFGRAPEEIRGPFVSWLVASGRHRRYRADAGDLWDVLERSGALDGELMHWYAAVGARAEGRAA